jgi:LPXTG-site transpeptidase (sortase) family protein
VVLIGHVRSIAAGQVFRHLQHARVSDELSLTTPDADYRYVVVDVRAVPRTDISWLEQTSGSMVTLITCTGVWLPYIQDYTERLVVRAALIGLPS